MSRIPVREAPLHILSTEGLVHLGVSGAVVTGLSIAELQELYELREAVDQSWPASRCRTWAGPRPSRWRPFSDRMEARALRGRRSNRGRARPSTR